MLRWIVFVMLVGLAAPASAQYGGARQIQPTRNAVWGDIGLFTGSHAYAVGGVAVASTDLTIARPALHGYIEVGPTEVMFDWGLAFADYESSGLGASVSESAFRFGNPFAGLRFRLEQRDFVLRIGGGLALPLAAVDEDDSAEKQTAQQLALVGATWISGLWDAWLWLPDRFTIVAPAFRMDSRSNDFVWALIGAMGIMIDTGDSDTTETEVPIQFAAEGGARLGRAFVIGGRLQAVFLATAEDGEDAAQLAVEPFVRFEGENGFGFAKLTVNLDDKLGFGFDDDGVWGLTVGGGARF